MKYVGLVVVLLMVAFSGFSQTKNPIFRYPDVSQTHIVFSFAGDLWLVEKSGGTAIKLSSPPGYETWARFSPDGQKVAFTGNYDGQSNIYTLPINGGLPTQITFHGMQERVVDWFPDGKHLLYSSSKYSGKQRFSQFYKVSSEGGLSEKLPIAHAEMGAISPDGKKIAFTDKSRLYRTWKRYRGGTASDIHIFDLRDSSATNITLNDANDELPMWCGDVLYYLSDQGKDMRSNIWAYDLNSKKHTQITKFENMDVHFPAAGPSEIVFEAGGDLYLLSLTDQNYKKVDIRVVADFDEVKPRNIEVKDYMQNRSVSPDGKRILVEARGEIFSVPAEKGFTTNLTQLSGSAERFPAWSPDGKSIAYWSDQAGEYELYLLDIQSGHKRVVTNIGEGFKYQAFWSPDSKHLAYIDQSLRVCVLDAATGKMDVVAKQKQMNHYALNNFSVTWSSDSKYLGYTKQLDNGLSAIEIYDIGAKSTQIISGGLYNLGSPVFDPQNKYLFVEVRSHYSPVYSQFDNSFVYTNSGQIAAFVLQKDGKSPLYAQNDEVELQNEEAEQEKPKDEEKKKGKKKDQSKEKETSEDEGSKKELVIDFEGLDARMVLLPMSPGNYGKLAAVEGKLIYSKYPHSGSSDGKASIQYFDLKEREEKTIMEDAGSFELSADGKKLLINKGRTSAVVDVASNQKMEKTVDFSGLRMRLDPKEEWQQLFDESWRIQRDYFYDQNMHGVDWVEVKSQYQVLLDRACSREDVNYIIGELIGELNASHAYRGGGDYFGDSRSDNIGYLGVDWEFFDGHFKVGKIIRAADWDLEDRSPLAEPGNDVSEGDYILAVNGVSLGDYGNPYGAFVGLAGKIVELEVNDKPTKEGARKVIVKTLNSETRLRNLAWIEENRRYVEEVSGGRIGYVYVPSTGLDGQYELVRMFYGQFKKDALIIDERFNNGGQIPDRFIELLDRKPLAFWKTRDGRDWQWPPVAHFGPKAMLINGWSGSGGDAFPDYFRKAGLGPLIGTRTWGGLIGISGTPPLVDGGSVTSPTFRMFHPDGEWFPEGHGVDPDIEVAEDYTSLARGVDAQLKRAIEELMKELETNPYVQPAAPPVEKRTK